MNAGKVLVLVLGAVLAAGCGTASSAAPHAPASATHTVTPPRATTATSDRAQPLELQAGAEAADMLAKFVPPPGAVRLAKQPKLPGGSPGMGVVYTTVAHATGYWRVHGEATALRDWEKAHMPKIFSGQDVIIGPPSWNTVYTLPPVAGRFALREMNVQLYDIGGGETVVIADAMVAWEPPRPASERVPASVKVVTIANGMTTVPKPEQTTITSAPVVQRLAALVNGLPLSTIGPAPCPSGRGFTLTFRDTADGPPVAVAKGPGGCGTVTFTLNGKDQPDLMVLDQTSYDNAILKIAGLPRTRY